MSEASRDATLTALQQEADRWVRARGRYWSPLSQFVRLTEEVGELGRELNHQFGDKPRAAKDLPARLADELGDVLFIVVLLANSLEVDLQSAWRQTLAKYEARLASPDAGVTEAGESAP